MNNKISRPKSASALRLTKTSNNQSNNHTQNLNNELYEQNQLKTNIPKGKYQLTHDEWSEVKKKQNMIYQKMQKIKEDEDRRMENIRKNVNKEYKKISKQKYNEWTNKKIMEKQRDIKQKQALEKENEERKLQKDDEKKQVMQLWFQRQAMKMEYEEKIKKEEKMKKEKIEEEKRKLNEEKKQKAEEQFA